MHNATNRLLKLYMSQLSISVHHSSLPGLDVVRFSNCSDNKSSSLTDHRPYADDDSTLKKMERKGSGMSTMEEMPCVSTRGNGPNGKRIEGFLYKYQKGEEVRIVCVCHGSFLTPAEFVRHAGGGDVDHPLRHIVVSPPSPFL